jgi:hypothetical protein
MKHSRNINHGTQQQYLVEAQQKYQAGDTAAISSMKHSRNIKHGTQHQYQV